MREALRIIVDRDGLKGLRRGMLPRILTVAPSTAISWMSYEFFSELFYYPQFLDDVMLRRYVLVEVLIRQGGHLPETGQVV